MSGLKLPISLEFFPPKTPEGTEKLRGVREKLYALNPEFCSVTYGAGGSTQEGTFATVGAIQAEGVTLERTPMGPGGGGNAVAADPSPTAA
jgi:methylenetetrahydrofolate reductase (NADPH)